MRQYYELKSLQTQKNADRIGKLQKKLPQEHLPAVLRLDSQTDQVFMTQDGNELGTLEDLVPSQNFVLNQDGRPAELPFDVHKKTI